MGSREGPRGERQGGILGGTPQTRQGWRGTHSTLQGARGRGRGSGGGDGDGGGAGEPRGAAGGGGPTRLSGASSADDYSGGARGGRGTRTWGGGGGGPGGGPRPGGGGGPNLRGPGGPGEARAAGPRGGVGGGGGGEGGGGGAGGGRQVGGGGGGGGGARRGGGGASDFGFIPSHSDNVFGETHNYRSKEFQYMGVGRLLLRFWFCGCQQYNSFPLWIPDLHQRGAEEKSFAFCLMPWFLCHSRVGLMWVGDIEQIVCGIL